jgi:hypothetical protein
MRGNYRDINNDPEYKILKEILNTYEGIDESLIKISSDRETLYADPEMKMFPLSSKEAVYTTYLYAKYQGLSNIEKMAASILEDIYGIDVSSIKPKKEKPLEKKADIHPLKDPFFKYRKYKTKVASVLTHTDIPEFVKIIPEKLKYNLELRKVACDKYGKPKEGIKYLKMASKVDGLRDKCITSKQMAQICDYIEIVDKKAGLTKEYEKRIPNPFFMVLDCIEPATPPVKVAGFHIDIKKMTSIPLDVYESILGEEFVKRIVGKDGEIDPDKLVENLNMLTPAQEGDLLKGLKKLNYL